MGSSGFVRVSLPRKRDASANHAEKFAFRPGIANFVIDPDVPCLSIDQS
ncbi:hypothetical protein [Desulfomicrobium apsheronum]|nr:hypothetical protein [Desulfomicrobium apsheronum]